MKSLKSVICVEEKPAMKRQRVRRKGRHGALCKGRAGPHATTSSPSSSFSHRNDVFTRLRRRQSAAKATRGHDTEARTRLFISNIANEVSSICDIIELLFKQIGSLRRHKIHCDPEGHFQGTAEVVYERWEDAIAAVRHYDNNINLFGRTWKVELVGENQISITEEASRRVATKSGACKQTIQSRLHECGSSRGGGKRALLCDSRKQKGDADLEEFYRERQPASGTKRLMLREALDADLDRYHKIAKAVKWHK